MCEKLVPYEWVEGWPVLPSRIIFMRLRLRAKILMRLRRLQLLPYYIEGQKNF
jgi:hypothetical protein